MMLLLLDAYIQSFVTEYKWWNSNLIISFLYISWNNSIKIHVLHSSYRKDTINTWSVLLSSFFMRFQDNELVPYPLPKLTNYLHTYLYIIIICYMYYNIIIIFTLDIYKSVYKIKINIHLFYKYRFINIEIIWYIILHIIYCNIIHTKIIYLYD